MEPLSKKGADKLRDSSQRALEGYENWKPQQLAEYLSTVGLGDYYEAVIMHKITGKLAIHLKDEDIKDMGITIVGDRLLFRQVIQSLSKKARFVDRTKVIWEGKEVLYFGCFDRMMGTCCGCFPDDPSTYKLSSNHLKVKVVEPGRCGPLKVCCWHSYKVNNIDLTHVTDVDVQGTPPPCIQEVCCCATGRDIIGITYAEGTLAMPLKKGVGETVSTLILNQVEETQVMERD
jgi:hypothetical protein